MALFKLPFLRTSSSVLTLWNLFESTSSKPVLPEGSTLHRINEYFTPLVEAQPEFNKSDLDCSVSARTLINLFDEKYLEGIEMKGLKLNLIKQDIFSWEKKRLDIHETFQEAMRLGDKKRLEELRAASKDAKRQKNHHREIYRTIAFHRQEELLKVPNKLRDVFRSLPDESWYSANTKNPETRPFFKFFDVDESLVHKDCGTYLTGLLAAMATKQMSELLERLRKVIDAAHGIRCRICNLSDIVRLPVAESCGWTSSLDEVIQIVHTKDDLYIPEDGGQVLINPYTRVCLVGSASLAAFVGSIFGSCVTVPEGGLNFLTLGNIYNYASKIGDSAQYPFKQTRQISFFALHPDKPSSVKAFDKLASTISQLWSELQPQWKIRLRVVPTPSLRYCEMARWNIAMVLDDRSEFELASISLLGDWISRRGNIKTPDATFPLMVFAELANLENLVAAVRKPEAFQSAPQQDE